MPKRVLFIISNMETGGVSKAMTSLLAVLGTMFGLDFANHIIELVLAVEIDDGIPLPLEARHQPCQQPCAGTS